MLCELPKFQCGCIIYIAASYVNVFLYIFGPICHFLLSPSSGHVLRKWVI